MALSVSHYTIAYPLNGQSIHESCTFLMVTTTPLYSLCYEIVALILQIILFLAFLFLSKHYTLRERKREVNIQAIAEEHYERYLDQEECMREQVLLPFNVEQTHESISMMCIIIIIDHSIIITCTCLCE